MEKLINTDLCIVCSQNCTEIRNSLTMYLDYLQKPIVSLIEEFTETSFTEEIISDAAICTDCTSRFIEYDNYLSSAKNIQLEITNLFFTENEQQGFKDEPDQDAEILNYENDIIEEDHEDFLMPDDVENSEAIMSIKYENKCEICGKSFKEKSKLKVHRLIHTDERNVICPKCGKSFKTKACLRAHKRVHNKRYVECDYCGKFYSVKSELLKHIQFVHLNCRDYQCQFCGAAFSSRGNLMVHYQSHEQKKALSCSICGFSFHTLSKLKRHERTHTGKRDFECEICGKQFLHSYNVNAHIKHVHLKIKRKGDQERCSCKICGKRFQRKDRLIGHYRNEHKEVETNEGLVVEEILIENDIQFVEIIQ